MLNPRELNDRSNMPAYPWLFDDKTDYNSLPKKIAVMTKVGVPYPPMTGDEIKDSARLQAMNIAKGLQGKGLNAVADTKVIALISYLQKLGQFDTPKVEERLTEKGKAIFPLKPGVPDKYRDLDASGE